MLFTIEVTAFVPPSILINKSHSLPILYIWNLNCFFSFRSRCSELEIVDDGGKGTAAVGGGWAFWVG